MHGQEDEEELSAEGEDEELSDDWQRPRGRRCCGIRIAYIACLMVAILVAAAIAVLMVTRWSEPTSATSPSASVTPTTQMPEASTSAQNTSKSAPGASTSVTWSGGVSLYCYMVVLPFGHERRMLETHHRNGVNIFGCNAYTVFSNETFSFGPNETTVSFGGDMVVKYNTWTWKKYNVKLALNTGVFLRAWKKLLNLGIWRQHDWIVKSEADTVFFPDRLQTILRSRPLLPQGVDEQSGETAGQCGNCASGGSCMGHVRWLQKSGKTCAEALETVAQPKDCGCVACGVAACEALSSSVYLRNCAHNFYTPEQKVQNKALHGPLEVLSRPAWNKLDADGGLTTCEVKLKSSFSQWGEDWFLEHCLLEIGVHPVDFFTSLSDLDCDPWHKNDGTCRTFAAAYQPFKTDESYYRCMENAKAAAR